MKTELYRAVENISNATLNRYWHEGIDATDEWITRYRGTQENKDAIEKYKAIVEEGQKRLAEIIKELEDYLNAPIATDTDGLYNEAEKSFKMMNSWHLGTDEFLKAIQQPAKNGWGEPKEQESGDIVHTDSVTASVLTRHMATEWWNSSGTYRHGFVAGYLAALQATRDKQ
jgi:hypothetical protein